MCVDGSKYLNPYFTQIPARSAVIYCSYFMHCVVLCSRCSIVFFSQTCLQSLVTSLFDTPFHVHASPESLSLCSKWATARFFWHCFPVFETFLLVKRCGKFTRTLLCHFTWPFFIRLNYKSPEVPLEKKSSMAERKQLKWPCYSSHLEFFIMVFCGDCLALPKSNLTCLPSSTSTSALPE